MNMALELKGEIKQPIPGMPVIANEFDRTLKDKTSDSFMK